MYPKTLDGRDLDSFCNTIDMELSDLLDPITSTSVPAEGPKPEGWIDGPRHLIEFDLSTIPSPAQREAFALMVTLLESARSLSGTLRYDVSVMHDDCPEHDDYARRKVDNIKRRIAAVSVA